MTASRAERGRRRIRCLAPGLALVLATACSTPAQVPRDGLLDPLPLRSHRVPDAAERSAVALAEAVWAHSLDDPAGARLLADRLEALARHEADRLAERDRERREEWAAARRETGPGARYRSAQARRTIEPPRLLPLARDAAHATLTDPRERRQAAESLLDDPDLDPALEQRLEVEIEDDPLRLARRRDRDDLSRRFAHHFNAVSAPLGRSLLSGFLFAPYTIAMTAVHWLAGWIEGMPMSTQERQALEHRREFLLRDPDAPEAPRVREAMQEAELELADLRGHRELSLAESAMEVGRPGAALAHSEAALRYVPGDRQAARLREEAVEDLAERRVLRRRSMESVDGTPVDLEPARAEATRRLLLDLWTDPVAVLHSARAVAAVRPRGPLEDEAVFALALVQHERGAEEASLETLEALGKRDPRRSNMARHAATLHGSVWTNPYGAWRRARSRGLSRAVRHEILGGYAKGPRYRRIPAPIAYLIDLPNVIRTAVLTPIRAFFGTFRGRPDFYDEAAILAYRYLERSPQGDHREEVTRWLLDYEESQERWESALRLADFVPGFDLDERQELVDKAAERRLEVASRIQRRDQRGSVLRSVVREFPDSEAGAEAGLQARAQVEHASTQRIRLTRGFLEENPEIAFHHGIGLRRQLLDGRVRNGELHPDGITFLGGRFLQIALLPASGDEEDAPVEVRKRISVERLSRTLALVDETARRNAWVDPDDILPPDARRDLYIERARLGLVEKPDPRPAAESTFVYQGIRERYGMVRGRDSVLPFDLVVQGSLRDLSLGAFPRWRPPRETPDAFLYR